MRLAVTAITESGLKLDDGSVCWTEPWEAVSDIQGARIPDGQSSILLLVIGLRDQRTILVDEHEPIWDALGAAIYNTFPGSVAPSIWKGELGKSGKITVYDAVSSAKV